MPKGARGKRHRKPNERLEFTIGFRIDRRKTAGASPAQLRRAMAQAKEAFLDDGDPDALDGIHVYGKWRNPDNKNPLHSNWKTSDDPGQSPSGFIKTIMERTGRL